MRDVVDPIAFQKLCWPDVNLYNKQREIAYSVRDNVETIVVSGNELGKDFNAGWLVLWAFLTHREVRIVTTSVKDKHLNILWGEIGRFIDTCEFPLSHIRGGPLIINHHHIKKIVDGEICKICYLTGETSEKGEGMAGHHAEYTLLVIDEASGVADEVYDIGTIWADRVLIFGNPNECNNFYYKAVKGGNVPSEDGSYLYRNVIKIKAQDSPNVLLAEAEKRASKIPSNRIVVPGVITYNDYQRRRSTLDVVRQCVSLDAEFYEGAEVRLYPTEWLNRAEELARGLRGQTRKAKAIGVDPAEGGDDTCMTATDELGVIEQISKKTPDTSVIPGEVLAFMLKHGVKAEGVYFDAGGGGKQHVDQLRSQGHKVNAIAFGGAASFEKRRGRRFLEERKEEDEVRYIYKNRRAEMYGILRLRLEEGFAIPAEYEELRRQLEPIPLMYDGEGRLSLPPKHKIDPNSTKVTMMDLIGCSPDRADSLVLAVFGMSGRHKRPKIGVAF